MLSFKKIDDLIAVTSKKECKLLLQDSCSHESIAKHFINSGGFVYLSGTQSSSDGLMSYMETRWSETFNLVC